MWAATRRAIRGVSGGGVMQNVTSGAGDVECGGRSDVRCGIGCDHSQVWWNDATCGIMFSV